MTQTPCKEFADRIVDYVDGELPQDEAQAVARHLAECERCRRTAEALQRSLGLAQVLWQDNWEDTRVARSDAVRRLCRGHLGRVVSKASRLRSAGGTTATRFSCPCGHTTNVLRRRSFYVLATAASVLLAAGGTFFLFHHRVPPAPVTWEEVQAQVARAGIAAELLAATRIVAQCEGTQSIVEQQYRYILREYAGTPAAESIKANQNLKLGGIHYD